jgi:hypothetical protein
MTPSPRHILADSQVVGHTLSSLRTRFPVDVNNVLESRQMLLTSTYEVPFHFVFGCVVEKVLQYDGD